MKKNIYVALMGQIIASIFLLSACDSESGGGHHSHNTYNQARLCSAEGTTICLSCSYEGYTDLYTSDTVSTLCDGIHTAADTACTAIALKASLDIDTTLTASPGPCTGSSAKDMFCRNELSYTVGKETFNVALAEYGNTSLTIEGSTLPLNLCKEFEAEIIGEDSSMIYCQKKNDSETACLSINLKNINASLIGEFSNCSELDMDNTSTCANLTQQCQAEGTYTYGEKTGSITLACHGSHDNCNFVDNESESQLLPASFCMYDISDVLDILENTTISKGLLIK